MASPCAPLQGPEAGQRVACRWPPDGHLRADSGGDEPQHRLPDKHHLPRLQRLRPGEAGAAYMHARAPADIGPLAVGVSSQARYAAPCTSSPRLADQKHTSRLRSSCSCACSSHSWSPCHMHACLHAWAMPASQNRNFPCCTSPCSTSPCRCVPTPPAPSIVAGPNLPCAQGQRGRRAHQQQDCGAQRWPAQHDYLRAVQRDGPQRPPHHHAPPR